MTQYGLRWMMGWESDSFFRGLSSTRRPDHVAVLSLFVSSKLYPDLVELRNNPETSGVGGAVGVRLDVEAAGWRRRTRGVEEESADLRVASGLRGCRSQCCLPSLWPSSV